MSTTAHDRPPPGALHRFSVEQYDRMVAAGVFDDGSRVELLEGWVVEMSPQDPRHSGTVSVVQMHLEALLPAGWFIRLQAPIATRRSRPEPDLAVVREPRRRYLDRHPGPADIALLVEVAHTSLPRDRKWKSRIYRRAGVPAYWIVNVRDGALEVLEEKGFRTLGTGDRVSLVIEGEAVGDIAVAELLP